MFNYILTSTERERDTIAEELKKFYFNLLDDEKQTFAKLRENRKSSKARTDYFEAVQRVGTFQQIAEIIGANWSQLLDEYNTKK